MSTILDLYSDIWAEIANHLDSSVLTLLQVGNQQLSSILHKSIPVIHLTNYGRILDFEALLHACHHLERIHSLSVPAAEYLKFVKVPTGALILPPTLTSLSLAFSNVIPLISPLCLSAMVPSLLHLALEDLSDGIMFALATFDLPPQLESLDLIHRRFYPIEDANFIASLPRTLLRLGSGWSNIAQWDEMPSKFDWPPCLEYLRLSADYRDGFIIEKLPRTLTKLDLSETSYLTTAFPKTTEHLVFPWRRFFPYLTDLRLAKSNETLDCDKLFDTILLETSLESSTVEQFISSGSWDLPSPHRSMTCPSNQYPPFKVLELPSRVRKLTPTRLQEIFDMLAPKLKSVDLVNFAGPPEATKHLASLSVLDNRRAARRGPETTVPDYRTLPPSVTSLTCDSIFPSDLSPSIKVLNAVRILRREETGAPNCFFPPALTKLKFERSGEQVFLHEFPTTITHLTLSISEIEDWNVIAERLVNLQHLAVLVSWDLSSKAIKPIASASLHTFFCRRTSHMANGLKMTDLFAASPPILPPSLTHLRLCSLAHATILSILPRNLVKLSLEELSWTADPNRTPFPHAEGLSQEALWKQFLASHPSIKELRIMGTEKKSLEDSSIPSISFVKFLPKSIRKFSCHNFFRPDLNMRDLCNFLPSPYCTYKIEHFSFTEQARDFREGVALVEDLLNLRPAFFN